VAGYLKKKSTGWPEKLQGKNSGSFQALFFRQGSAGGNYFPSSVRDYYGF
jgi:hypothetical protein